MSETQRWLQKLLIRCRENWYGGLPQLLLHPSPLPKFPLPLLQIPSAVRHLPTPLLEGPSPVCSDHDQAASLVARPPLLLWANSNPPCSTSVLQLSYKEQVKRCSFPSGGVFFWLIPAPAGASGRSSRSPLSLRRCGCRSIPSNPVSTSFLWHFQACHLKRGLAWLSAGCVWPQCRRARRLLLPPGAPRAQPFDHASCPPSLPLPQNNPRGLHCH